jgi:hypothetical protein
MREGRGPVGSPLTEGTVTILFTDVEGSTALHADKGDAEARAILAACDDLVRQQVQAHGGRAVKSLGDGLMVTFASSRRAVACALGIQDAITAYGYRQPNSTSGFGSGFTPAKPPKLPATSSVLLSTQQLVSVPRRREGKSWPLTSSGNSAVRCPRRASPIAAASA